jgi:hypothetical protein
VAALRDAVACVAGQAPMVVGGRPAYYALEVAQLTDETLKKSRASLFGKLNQSRGRDLGELACDRMR